MVEKIYRRVCKLHVIYFKGKVEMEGKCQQHPDCNGLDMIEGSATVSRALQGRDWP